MRFSYLIVLLFSSLIFVSCSQKTSATGAINGAGGDGKETGSGTDGKPKPHQMQCSKVQIAKQTLSYCYQDLADLLQSPEPTASVIYYWHGIDGTPQQIFSTKLMSDLSAKLGPKMPIVVALSLGTRGLVTDQTMSAVQFGLFGVEKKISQTKKFNRILLGNSMGGYNSLRTLAGMPSRFSSVAALCPALITFDPYNSQDVDAYMLRNAAHFDDKFFAEVFDLLKTTFPNKPDWTANDPFTFLAQGAYDHKNLFLSVGQQDTLGFQEGTAAFATQAQTHGIAVKSAPVDGGHCAFDQAALFDFLAGQISVVD